MSFDIEQAEQIVNDLRKAGVVTVRGLPSVPTAEANEQIQKIVEFCGFRLPPLHEIDRGLAQTILVSLLHRDMAYDDVCIPLDRAMEIADGFLARFDSSARYFTNGEFLTYEESGIEPSLLRISGWNPMTDSTFDSGVVCLGSEILSLFWFQDED